MLLFSRPGAGTKCGGAAAGRPCWTWQIVELVGSRRPRRGGGGARRRLCSAQPSQISIDCPPCTCTCRPELAPFSSHGSAMSDMHVKIDLSCSAWVPTVYTIELRRQMDS
jgi:hypothetical protein